MSVFFLGLTLFERIIFVVATVSSILLAIQILFLLLGIGDGLGDISGIDAVEIGTNASEGLSLSVFTIKGIIGFFAVGGWASFAVSQAGGHISLVIISYLVAGGAALFGIAHLYKLSIKMQSDGTIQHSNAIGKVATVYLTIPAKGNGSGKVHLTVQERYIEMEAVTEGDEPIKSDEMVSVVGCYNNTLIVEKNHKNQLEK